MRSSKLQKLVATVLVLGAGWVFRYPAMYAWMQHTGALSPHGTNTENWMGKPGMIMSMVGHPPQMGEMGFSRSMGVYHVLVLFPADSLTPREWSSRTSDFSGAMSQGWDVWSGEPGHERAIHRTFATSYDGLRQTAELAGRRYSLADGNLFVVRFHARGGVSVRQLRYTHRDLPSLDVVFQALLPGDPAVRNLMHYDYGKKPCPRRQASPPRGAST